MHVEGGGMYITCCDFVVYYQLYQMELYILPLQWGLEVHTLYLGRDLVSASYAMTLIYPHLFQMELSIRPLPWLQGVTPQSPGQLPQPSSYPRTGGTGPGRR